MKKIKKFGITEYDILSPDETLDRLLELTEKLNEVIEVVNMLMEDKWKKLN